jgi:Major Facilitator Superfamily
MMAMGQVAFLLVVSVMLQDGRHLSALDTGLWLIPSGVAIVAGSQLGNWLTRQIGTTNVVRAGLFLVASGLAATALVAAPGLRFVELLPPFILVGFGIGFAGSQLNNVILSDIPPERAGAASGANTTVRMIGASLGISVISALLTMQTIRHAVSEVGRLVSLPPNVRAAVITQIHTSGVNFAPQHGTAVAKAQTLRVAIDHAVITGARAPLIFAAIVVYIATALSFFIPQVGPRGSRQGDTADEELEFAILESELEAETAAIP